MDRSPSAMAFPAFSETTQKCLACEKTVYLVDELAADGRIYHRACFRCHHCKGTLKRSDLISGISEDCYLELLCFLGNNWLGCCSETSVTGVPIFKYTNQYGRIALCSIDMIINRIYKICFLSEYQNISWLSSWNNKLKGASNYFFIPEPTQYALDQFAKREQLRSWMHEHLGIESISLLDFTYAVLCNCQSTKDTGVVVGFTHFLDQSLSKRYLTEEIVSAICDSLPVIDKYGCVIKYRNGVLVPASVSMWVELAGTNLWAEQGYVELGGEYFHHESFFGEIEKQNQFIYFLKSCVNAVDIPEVCPPDAGLPAAYSPLSKDSALLLLEWIHKATAEGTRLPDKFLKSIQGGKWLKTSLGYKSPSETFLCTSKWKSLLEVGSAIEDIPFVDEKFYDNQIDSYVNELERLEVVSDVEECCLFITHRLTSVAKTSTLSKDSVLSMLKFIKYVIENKIAYEEEIIRSFQGEGWIKTLKGFRSPLESVMFNSEWEEFQQISDLPFVDVAYYDEEIQCYEDTLKHLGVAIEFDNRYDLITENFRFPILSLLTVNSSLSILECVRHSSSPSPFIELLMEQEWIKTNVGYRSPKVCFLFDPSWGCLLTWASVPIVDESFYGKRIQSFSNELEAIGVSISFEGICRNIAHHVKLLLCSSVTKEVSLSLLECFKQLRKNGHSLSGDLKKCILQEKWIKTSVGFRTPCESAIYNSGWEHISQFADLPFIDKSYYGEHISLYMDELTSIGVIVNSYKAFQVVSGFKFPRHEITPGSMISLLECIKHQVAESSEERLPAEFLRCIRGKKWIKTCIGYRSPVKCFLYDSEWESVLKREDGPFIDESFYGPVIVSYWKELSLIGVKVRFGSGCGLLSKCLKFHSDFSAIVRIYSYLHRFNWELKPEEKPENWIWIPNENHDAGEWVSSKICVIHFVNHAPCSNIKVLDRYYDDNLLPFFSTVFGVPLYPASNQQ